jgi:hypothetical protein
MYGFLGIVFGVGVCVANAFSSMIKGFTWGAKDFVSGEWRKIFLDVCGASNWG